MAELRKRGPVVAVTSITGLVSQDASCEWQAQFMARHEPNSWDRVPDDEGPEMVNWRIRHPAMVAETREEWRMKGYDVTIENQNWFKLVGSSGTKLWGKPDLIAVSGNQGVIIDIKTGKPRQSDVFQVMCYMWGVPLYKDSAHYGKKFKGLLVYDLFPDKEIKAATTDGQFVKRLGALINRVASDEPALKVPNWHECQFCKITATDCPERVAEEPEGTLTDAFA